MKNLKHSVPIGKDHCKDQDLPQIKLKPKAVAPKPKPFDRTQRLRTLLLTLTCLVVLDYFTRDFLFEISIPIIQYFRSIATPGWDKFFSIVSEFGDKYVISLFVIISFNFLDQPKCFLVSLNAYSALALLSILKSINHEPRPFHVHDISPSKCWLEYGNPSGHSLISSCLFLTLWQLYCKSKGWDALVPSLETPEKWRKRMTALAAAIACILLVSFSRVWLGVHTLNQIFYGWMWGSIVSLLYCDILYFEICRFTNSLRTKDTKRLLFNFGTRNFFLIYTLALLTFLVGSVLNPTPKVWIENLQKNCAGKMRAKDSIDPEWQNFEKFNLAFSVVGVYLGIIVESKLVGTDKYPFYTQTSVGCTVVRMVATFIIGLPSIIGIFMKSDQHSYLVVQVCKYVLPATCGNFYLFGFSKWVALKLNLINTRQPAPSEDTVYFLQGRESLIEEVPGSDTIRILDGWVTKSKQE